MFVRAFPLSDQLNPLEPLLEELNVIFHKIDFQIFQKFVLNLKMKPLILSWVIELILRSLKI